MFPLNSSVVHGKPASGGAIGPEPMLAAPGVRACVESRSLTFSRPAKLQDIVNVLTASEGLRTLEFEHLSIDERDAREIAALARKLPALENLRIRNCTITKHGLEELSRALTTCAGSFAVTGTPIGRAMKALAPALRDSSLQHVTLANTGIDDDQLGTLCSALEDSPALKSLQLRGNRFHDGTALARLVTRQRSLTGLSLEQLGHDASRPVLEALLEKTCPLECLEMTRTDRGRDDSARLAWWSLVARVLMCNGTLSTVNFSDNHLTSDALALLGEALRHNRSLRTLELGQNFAATFGIDAFLEAIEDNFHLTTLVLNPGSLTAEQRDKLEAVMHRNAMRQRACTPAFIDRGNKFFLEQQLGLPGHLSEQITGYLDNDVDEMRRPPVLPQLNRATRNAAVDARSADHRDQILGLLAAGDRQAASKLLRGLHQAGVVPLAAHMDEIMDWAAKTPGQLPALLATLREAGIESSASPEKLASLLAEARHRQDEEWVEALLAAGAVAP